MLHILLFPLLLSFSVNCSGDKQNPGTPPKAGDHAVVRSVSAAGSAGNYTFSVELKSPDTGCGQYADWWEVLNADGKLIYRRILAHSHVHEQPFTRSGGPVKIAEDDVVTVRAHMHPGGYGSGKIAMKGSVKAGFQVFELPEGFAADVEKQAPQPIGCAF